MNARSIFSLGLAFAFLSVSKSLERHGDAIPHGAGSERLTWHLLALLLLLAALAAFIHAGLGLFRRR